MGVYVGGVVSLSPEIQLQTGGYQLYIVLDYYRQRDLVLVKPLQTSNSASFWVARQSCYARK